MHGSVFNFHRITGQADDPLDEVFLAAVGGLEDDDVPPLRVPEDEHGFIDHHPLPLVEVGFHAGHEYLVSLYRPLRHHEDDDGQNYSDNKFTQETLHYLLSRLKLNYTPFFLILPVFRSIWILFGISYFQILSPPLD